MRAGGTAILLAGLVPLLGACEPDQVPGGRPGGGADGRVPPGMMRGMMRDMANMPEGVPATALPEPGSRGARLVARYCGTCHGIPTPRRLSAPEWPATLERMFARMEHMEGMGGMGMMAAVEAPTAGEREAILTYLQAHALQAASRDALPAEDPTTALFVRTCSRCHALPDPAQHAPPEWPAVVARMRANMRRMDVEGITDAEARLITRYLQRNAEMADAAPGQRR